MILIITIILSIPIGLIHRLQIRGREIMINHTNTNAANIQSLENSIQVYADYKSKVSTSHLTDELKQAKIQELDTQITECKEAIDRLKE